MQWLRYSELFQELAKSYMVTQLLPCQVSGQQSEVLILPMLEQASRRAVELGVGFWVLRVGGWQMRARGEVKKCN